VGTRFCVGVGNGLEALTMVLKAWGIGAGDEVIVPSNTYIATWLAVTAVGGTPVPVEPDERTFNLAPDAIEAAITSRTRAVLPVHLYGMAADMEPIVTVARRHGLKVLDDAAQAHGARYKGRRVGSLADATAWSFYPSKNLGAFGDAGAVTTADPDLAQQLRVLRNYGSRSKYQNEVVGTNSRLDPLQAAILSAKLSHLDSWNSIRAELAETYELELRGTPGITLPQSAQYADHAWHVFVIRTRQRQALQEHLAKAGIQTLIHYPTPPHLQRAYAHLGLGPGSFPISERIHDEVISLPIGPHLSRSNAIQVATTIRSWAREARGAL
jgi:dTDP-4-amino-4,6-dideoxygalactose transaminase